MREHRSDTGYEVPKESRVAPSAWGTALAAVVIALIGFMTIFVRNPGANALPVLAAIIVAPVSGVSLLLCAFGLIDRARSKATLVKAIAANALAWGTILAGYLLAIST